jgi:prepilin-type N-terminal cleavage/methylation domain-containing protein
VKGRVGNGAAAVAAAPAHEEGAAMKRSESRRWESGFSLLETLVASAILGMLAVVGIGSFGRLCAQSSTQALGEVVRAMVARAQGQAVIRRTYTAVVFEPTDVGAAALIYEDGDGDGVTREDIKRGTDRPLTSTVLMKEGWAYLGLPDSVKTDPMGNPLGNGDPIRFGRGDILSFGPNGTGTPGSLYLRDIRGTEAWAFRVAGIDGRIRYYRWWKGKWKEVR